MSEDNLNKNSQDNSEEVFYDTDQFDDTDNSSALKKIKNLKEELEKCKKEKQEYLDGWQRSKADFVNFKKRAEEDKKSLIKYSTEEFIIQLIPAMDSFELAFKNKEAWEKAPPDWRTGIEFIHSQLKKVLTDNGVSEINPINEKFDPKLHHSIDTKDIEDNEKDGKILEVIQTGYKLGDKIIKYPNVVVGKKK
ncbi:MAG TPA: nucleotide exchange factor GrpE [Candidatus Paceibacterota bacterium]|nr:nucleotide exchange factor GrpE [Candidatus Paceibacterota bacterium]